MTTRAGSTPPVVRAGAGDEEILARFFRKVWNPASTAEGVRRAMEEAARTNPVDPGEPPPTFIFVKGGEAIGYVTTLPARFRVGGRDRPGYWLKGLAVLPEFQGGPVGFHLVRRAAEEVDFLASLAVARPARRLLEAVGFREEATPVNFVRLLRAGRVAGTVDPVTFQGEGGRRGPVALWRAARATGLARPLGALAGGLAHLRGSLRKVGYAGRVHSGWEAWSPDRVQALWGRRAGDGYQGVVRDPEYLGLRYRGSADEEYVPLFASSGAELDALAALRRPREVTGGRFRGLRLAWLTELLLDPGDARSRAGAGALVRAAEQLARDGDADLLFSSFSGPPEIQVMTRAGHLRTAGTMRLLVKCAEQAEAGSDEWVVTRGDGDSDSVT